MPRRAWWALGMLACLQVAAAPAEPLPIELFAREPEPALVTLSPDGRRVAALRGTGPEARLVVLDLQSRAERVVARLQSGESLAWLGWKSPEHLLYQTYTREAQPRLAAVGADGSRHLQLLPNSRPGSPQILDRLIDWLPEDPAGVLLASAAREEHVRSVYRAAVDAEPARQSIGRTVREDASPAARRLVVRAPGRAGRYLSDLQGRVRTCLTHEEDNARRLLYRADAGSPWTELLRVRYGAGTFEPIGFAPDNRRLYVLSNLMRDTVALFLYDPARPEALELLFETPGTDLGEPLYGADRRRLLGVSYHAQAPGVHYVDPQAERVHRAVMAHLPDRQTLLAGLSIGGGRALIRAGSPSDPGAWYVYDRDADRLTRLYDVAPWIDPARMAGVRPVRIAARDGLTLEGYLTLPRARPAGTLPLIVHVHGGPHGARHVATFDRDAQLLASRGYAVLQVNFRGSGGYGRTFRAAGYGQWGRRMQDDLADAARWAIESGIADAERVGIYGSSYGGYAAIMALVTHPEVFRCAASLAGVTDLRGLLERTRIDAPGGLARVVPASERLVWSSVIGLAADAPELAAVSPVHVAGRIRAPLLLAHGTHDLVIPHADATALHDALVRAGRPAELLSLAGEGHALQSEARRRELYERLAAFFDAQLGARATAAIAPAASAASPP